jgi:UDP-N-acetylmuramyl pentapeptide phosphotransferase/UDP-N-acetylglucosamine-1-phosphate transferase
MWMLAVAFVFAFVVTLVVVRSSGRIGRFVGDHDLSGPQKFHSRSVPRIGGLGIFLGVVAAAGVGIATERVDVSLSTWLLFSSLPAFLSGLAEDLTKSQSPRRRLFFTSVSAAMAVLLVDASIGRTDIPGLDWLVGFAAGSFMVTVFVVAGVANAVNIIDGFNGLAAMCVVLMLAGLGYVALNLGDSTIAWLGLAGIAAVLGFFVLNFPAGLVFLGDGGAYFLGFYLAELAILLMHRNDAVSPLFPLLLCLYPVFETLFSIYRKKVIRGMSPGVPDGVHLHMLVFKRLVRWAVGNREARTLTRRNSMTSPYLWVLCSLSVVPAVVWYDNTPILAGFIVAFAVVYVGLYWRIVRFKSPRWLVFRPSRPPREG